MKSNSRGPTNSEVGLTLFLSFFHASTGGEKSSVNRGARAMGRGAVGTTRGAATAAPTTTTRSDTSGAVGIRNRSYIGVAGSAGSGGSGIATRTWRVTTLGVVGNLESGRNMGTVVHMVPAGDILVTIQAKAKTVGTGVELEGSLHLVSSAVGFGSGRPRISRKRTSASGVWIREDEFGTTRKTEVNGRPGLQLATDLAGAMCWTVLSLFVTGNTVSSVNVMGSVMSSKNDSDISRI